MTDYKELISALREEAEAVQAIEWEVPICTSNHIADAADAIEQLVTDIDVAHKERDAAISELRSIGDNCFCCRWWEDEPSDGDWWSHNHCSCPDTCLVDGNPDRWEWRGVTR